MIRLLIQIRTDIWYIICYNHSLLLRQIKCVAFSLVGNQLETKIELICPDNLKEISNEARAT